jgi:dihydrodipicolinate synthase/N-acetylneuraminate lyase
MKALKAEEIYGNWATLLLPINGSGEINYIKLNDEIDYLTACNVNGIYSNGTAGEFYTLNENEFDRINQMLAEKCKYSNTSFQIGVSHSSAQISLERLKRIRELEPGAIQLILPDWYPVTTKEAVHFLEIMAEAAGDIGLVLYNPPHAKRVLKPKEWDILKKSIPNLVGVKVFDQNGKESWYKKARKYGKGISIFVPGHNLATGISKGAHGSYSNVACLNPLGAQKWYNMMEDDMEKAFKVEDNLQYFLSTYIFPLMTQNNYSNQAIDKLLSAIGGWVDITPRLRWPYRWVPEATAQELRSAARKILSKFFIN